MTNKDELIVQVGTVDEFFERIRLTAAALDQGAPVAPGTRLTFEDPEEMTSFLSEFRRSSLAKPATSDK